MADQRRLGACKERTRPWDHLTTQELSDWPLYSLQSDLEWLQMIIHSTRLDLAASCKGHAKPIAYEYESTRG